MTTTDPDTDTMITTQVHRVYIKATPQAIWDAITTSEWTARYGYRYDVDYDLRPGGAYRALASPEMKQLGAPDVIADGEIVESDPPRLLVQTWRLLMDDGLAAEGFTRLTYEIGDEDGGVCSLTVIHDLAGTPKLAALVGGQSGQPGGGGWPWILSGLKSLLETGEALPPPGAPD
jgi:uncharacterized protein YndB with AHSA1/START domain